MSTWLFVMILLSTNLPWDGRAFKELSRAKIQINVGFTENSRPFAAALDGKVIYWYPVVGTDMVGDLVHESQHWLACRHGFTKADWNKFGRIAIKALRSGNYEKPEIFDAKYILTYGGHELHAELPIIVGEDIPSCLASWYPWFKLGAKVK